MSGNPTTNQKMDKDEDTDSVADSALGTVSVVSGATFGEVSCSTHTHTETAVNTILN